MWGRQKGITPICSELRFLPICVPCFQEYHDLFRFAPISSDLVSDQIRTNQGNPFLPTAFVNPRHGDAGAKVARGLQTAWREFAVPCLRGRVPYMNMNADALSKCVIFKANLVDLAREEA